MKDRASYIVNLKDTFVSFSKQLYSPIPRSKNACSNSGKFVVMIVDYTNQKIDLKAFHSPIINDYSALNPEQDNYKEIPVEVSIK